MCSRAQLATILVELLSCGRDYAAQCSQCDAERCNAFLCVKTYIALNRFAITEYDIWL